MWCIELFAITRIRNSLPRAPRYSRDGVYCGSNRSKTPTMSKKHPIISVTGSSGAGTTSTRKTFEEIFLRENVTSVFIEGRGSASIAIASEFFWVSVMVVFMVACACKNIHRVAKDFDFGSGCTLSTTSPVNFRNFALPKDAITCNSLRVRDRLKVGGRVWVV